MASEATSLVVPRPFLTPFLSWPREVRDHVYASLFSSSATILVYESGDKIRINGSDNIQSSNMPQLVYTCKQVHEEAWQIVAEQLVLFLYLVDKPVSDVDFGQLLPALWDPRRIRRAQVIGSSVDDLSVFPALREVVLTQPRRVRVDNVAHTGDRDHDLRCILDGKRRSKLVRQWCEASKYAGGSQRYAIIETFEVVIAHIVTGAREQRNSLIMVSNLPKYARASI